MQILITGHDEMVREGMPALLQVKVERQIISYLAPNIANVEVGFAIDGKVIGSSISDAIGIAELEYIPEKSGMYVVGYRLQLKDKKIEYRTGRLFVISGKRPAVVVDIDGTISNLPDWKVPFQGSNAPIFPHADEFLKKLSSCYEIVYITARDDILDKVTLSFLEKHGFPQAPVFYNDWRRYLNKPEEFKAMSILKLQRSGVPVVAGIGDSSTDVKAYLEAGIDVYIRKGEMEIDYERVTIFRDYRELEHIFFARDDFYRKSIREIGD